MELSQTLIKRLIAAGLFVAVGLYLASIVPSVQIAWVTAILLLTIFLFAFEVVDVDVAAVTVMVVLGLTSLLAPLMGMEKGLVDNTLLFNGFASNAVISIIAVMIIGAGLDKTGIMTQVANFILKTGGSGEARIIPLISSTVGVISSFMQNVGAAALFLPVVSRISARTGLPMSRLLMPMGFCAILGGTITMVGSSPLILLNDLILTSNQGLPEALRMDTFSLFSVTPIGLALVATGILYFVVAGRFVLPANKSENVEGTDAMTYFAETYGLMAFDLFETRVPDDSPLVGQSVAEIEAKYGVRIIAVDKGDGRRVGADGVDRDLGIEAGTVFGFLSHDEFVHSFEKDNNLKVSHDLEVFGETLSTAKAGIAEIVVPPSSSLIGKSARDVWLRKRYGLSLLAVRRGEEVINAKTGGVRDVVFQAGDTLVVHTLWSDLARLQKDPRFVVITTEFPHEELRPTKVPAALIFFGVALGLILLPDMLNALGFQVQKVPLSVALLTGALGMILSGVLSIEEAYKAVSWKTVFLLASLIPLGLAVETSGTAAWIAEQTLEIVGDMPVWIVQAAIAVLATFFTLVMSNVGATVLLVPLAVNIALGVGGDPAVFALTVAIATSNSFLIPTHQVNALIMGPAGYRVPDFMKAGGVMTVLFLVVSLSMLNLVF